METRVLLSTVNWISNSSGFWDDPGNWQDRSTLANRVPDGSDDVLIDRGAGNPTITVRDNRTVRGLTDRETILITGGTLTVNGASQINGGKLTLNGRNLAANDTVLMTTTGKLDWKSGTIYGNGLQNSGTFTISATADVALAGTLTNSGLIQQSGTGNLVVNGTLNNALTGVFDFKTDAGIIGSNVINNSGVFRKTVGSGVSRIGPSASSSLYFNQLGGTLDAQSGTLQLDQTNTSVLETGGIWNASAGAILDFEGNTGSGTYFAGTFTGSGGGVVQLSSGRFGIDSSGATFNFPTGLLNWTGGAFFSQPLTNKGTITLSGVNDKALGSTLNNDGHLIMKGTGNLVMTSPLNNDPTGVIDFQSNSGISGNSSNAVINNQGTIKKSAGTGVSRIGPAANSVCYVNQLGGTLNALKGTLQLDQTSTSVTDTGGIWNASTGATLDFEGNVASGTYFAGTFTGSGGGVVQLSSGRFGIDSGGATFNFPAGLLQWSGGTFFSQPLTNTGVITLWGSDVKDLNNQLINTGTIIHSGTGDLVLGGGTVNNQASGLYDFRANVQIIGNSGTLNNSGILRKSAGSGESRLGTPDPNPGNSSFNFNNTGGTIDVQHGTINLASGGISTGGVFNAAAGGVLKITGNLAITGVYTGAGTGRIDFAGGSLLPCDTGIPGASATFNFPKGLFHWTGGEISGGISGIGIGSAAVLNNLGFISMDGPNTKSIRRNTIVNFGTIIDAGPGDLLLHGIDDFGTSAIDNRAGATFEFQGDALIDELPGNKGIFINAGTVKKTSGTGIAEIDGTFNSTAAGLIDVESGHLRLGNGGLFTGGAFNVAAGSVLEFGLASGYFTMLGTYTGSGLGSIDFQGGLSGGDDSTPAILNFAPGYFHMSGVWAGTVENDGWITLDGNRARAHIINVGTIVQTGPDDFNLNANTYFENRGLYDIQTVASLIVPNDGSGGNMRFFNTGTLRKSGGTGTSQLHHATTGNAFRLDNQGTVEVLSGTLEIDDPVVQLSGSKLTGGTWNVKHGATLTLPAGTNITTNQGNIVLDGTGATLTAIASLSANEGSLSLSGGVSFATVGNLSNSGTLVLGSHGTLKVNGDLTEVQTSAIQVQIAGTPTSHSFGNLVVAAEANLNGKLIVRLAEGFGPTAGNVYTVLGYGSKQGAFGVIAGLPPFFTANVNATSVRLNAGASAANIAVQSIVVPASATIGQHVPISYTVKNTTNIRINETWTDSIYLSKDTDFGPEDVLVARVPHTGGLAAFGSYQGTANAVLPNLTDGNYHVIVVADSSVNVPDTDRSDNTLASANEIQVHVPLLTLAVPFHGKIASHQESLYRINVPAGSGDLILNADFAAALEANVFIRYAGLPDSAHADASFLYQTSQHGQLVIANPQAGSYYVFVQGREGAATPKNFTLTARLAGLEIRGVSPSRGSNAGQTTITISGSGFSVRSAVALVSGGTTRNATSVLFKDSNTLFATFDLTGLAAGTFNVKVVDGVRNTTNAGVFTVVTGHFGVVTFDFVVPAVTRPGQAQTLLLNYTNTGDTDVPAPLFHITGDNAVFRLPEQPNFNSDSIEVLGINNQGPAGILPPGFRGQLSVIYLPVTSGAHVASNFTAALEDPNVAIDWTESKDSLRPFTIPSDAWDVVFANFTAKVGTKSGQFIDVLRADATYLSQLGIYTGNVARLLAFELKIDDDFGSVTRGYTNGALGRGQTDPVTMFAATDDDGNVTVQIDGVYRPFLKNVNGSYTGVPGDQGVLTKLSTGGYSLREALGRTTIFSANGNLDSIVDPNGYRTTATYTGSHLTRLVDSFGDVTSYIYNSDGHIIEVTDPVGRMTTYTYDATGNVLTSIISATGITTFDYVSHPTIATRYAISSITYPDGTQINYQYDAQGRIIKQSSFGGANPVTYAYGSVGEMVVMDAAGNATHLLRDDNDAVAATTDPLQQTVLATFDSNEQLTDLVGSGAHITEDRDALGNPARLTDSVGNSISIGYDSAFNRPTSYVDANGQPIYYQFNSHGQVVSVTNAAGLKTLYSYDPAGNRTQTVLASGLIQTVTYDSHNLVKSRTFSDGTRILYSYDSHRNLTMIADASGVTAMKYDGADRLTNITYPSGRFVHYTYDSFGRRTQVATQDGFVVNYNYDSLGRLVRVRDSSNNTLATYTYDVVGRLHTQSAANGTSTTYSYDAASRLTSVVNRGPANNIQSRFIYTYDSLGRRLTMTTLDGTTSYSYDAVGQLTSIVLPGGRVVTYLYDGAGNRVQVTDSNAVAAVDYTTNDVNEYTAVGNATFTYDDDGNLLARTDATGVTKYTYNSQGRLVGVTNPTNTWTFEYDALGNRSAIVHNGVRTTYLVDCTGLSNVIGSYDGTGKALAFYVQGNGLLSQVDAEGSADFYQFDGQGNTAALTDQDGKILNTYSYLPFGEKLVIAGTTPNPFTFVGQSGVMDGGEGSYYMRNRYYEPNLGRFLQSDPSGLQGGTRTYTAMPRIILSLSRIPTAWC